VAPPLRAGLDSKTGSIDLSALGLRKSGFMYISFSLFLFTSTSKLFDFIWYDGRNGKKFNDGG
jgi:hypothetical protein